MAQRVDQRVIDDMIGLQSRGFDQRKQLEGLVDPIRLTETFDEDGEGVEVWSEAGTRGGETTSEKLTSLIYVDRDQPVEG